MSPVKETVARGGHGRERHRKRWETFKGSAKLRRQRKSLLDICNPSEGLAMRICVTEGDDCGGWSFFVSCKWECRECSEQ